MHWDGHDLMCGSKTNGNSNPASPFSVGAHPWMSACHLVYVTCRPGVLHMIYMIGESTETEVPSGQLLLGGRTLRNCPFALKFLVYRSL